MVRRLTTGCAAAAALALTPGAASAAQFCVGAGAGPTCDGGTYAFDAAGLNGAALAANARAGADELRIAAGTITGAATVSVTGNQGLAVHGAPLPGPTTTLQFAAGTTAGISTTGLSSVSNLTLVGNGVGSGVVFGGGATQTATRLRIRGFAAGVSAGATEATGTTVSDSVIDLGPIEGARGIYAVASSSADSTVSVNRVTVAGTGETQGGVMSFATGSGTASTSTSSSAVYLNGAGSQAFVCETFFGGTATASQTGSAFRTPAGDCAGLAAPLVDLSLSNPWFVDLAAGDLRLLSSSPMIDRGTGIFFLITPTDAAGVSRLTDGDGDGARRVDLGGLEYRRQAPNPPDIDMPVTTFAPGEAIQFKATATDPDGEFPFITWDFGDGSGASGFLHAYTALGTYTATATATDPVGLKSTRQIQITVANPVLPPSAAAPTPAAKLDPFATATGPRVRVLAAPTRSIKRSTNGFATVTTADARTATLESAGAVTLRVRLTRLLAGRRATSTSRCRATTRKGRRCTVRRPVSAVGQVPVAPGTIVLRFGGKLGLTRLAAGRYEVSVTPVGIDKRRGTPATYAITLR